MDDIIIRDKKQEGGGVAATAGAGEQQQFIEVDIIEDNRKNMLLDDDDDDEAKDNHTTITTSGTTSTVHNHITTITNEQHQVESIMDKMIDHDDEYGNHDISATTGISHTNNKQDPQQQQQQLQPQEEEDDEDEEQEDGENDRTSGTISIKHHHEESLHDQPMPEEEEKQQQQEKNKDIIVGGNINTPAYCLLDGVYKELSTTNDPTTSTTTTTTNLVLVRIPIIRLPAFLGRTHKSDEMNFVGMGKTKTISRMQCRIDYHVGANNMGKLIHKKGSTNTGSSSTSNTANDNDHPFVFMKHIKKTNLLNSKGYPPLPTGYYTITCLGKNAMFVDGIRLDKDQTTIIISGSTIGVSTFSLYFLLPIQLSTKRMEIVVNKKRGITTSSSSTTTTMNTTATTNTAGPTSSNTVSQEGKRKKSKVDSSSNAPISSVVKKVKGSSSSVVAGSSGVIPGLGGGPPGPLQAEIDAMSTMELRRLLTEAIDENIWERRHQLIGATISCRAVLDAAKDPTMIQQSRTHDGVSRGEIMNWISNSQEFGVWSQQMLMKLEMKSYQASITKAMVKGGFKRTATTGRYIKWILPSSDSSSSSDNNNPNSIHPINNNDRIPNDKDNDEEDEDREDQGNNDSWMEENDELGMS